MRIRRNKCDPTDLIGKVFSKYGVSLTVLGVHGRDPKAHNQYNYDCVCSCGAKLVKIRDSLRKDDCAFGCKECMKKYSPVDEKVLKAIEEVVGKRFGFLVATGIVKRGRIKKDSTYKLKCDCGGEIEMSHDKLIRWNALAKPHCKECRMMPAGLVKLSTKEIVVPAEKKSNENIKKYSDKDPFINRRKCMEECNVCVLRQFVCCRDCTMYSDYEKCYKHCHKDPKNCGSCFGGKDV